MTSMTCAYEGLGLYPFVFNEISTRKHLHLLLLQILEVASEIYASIIWIQCEWRYKKLHCCMYYVYLQNSLDLIDLILLCIVLMHNDAKGTFTIGVDGMSHMALTVDIIDFIAVLRTAPVLQHSEIVFCLTSCMVSQILYNIIFYNDIFIDSHP